MPGFLEDIDTLQTQIVSIKAKRKRPDWLTEYARILTKDHIRAIRWLETCGKLYQAKRLAKSLKSRLNSTNQYM